MAAEAEDIIVELRANGKLALQTHVKQLELNPVVPLEGHVTDELCQEIAVTHIEAGWEAVAVLQVGNQWSAVNSISADGDKQRDFKGRKAGTELTVDCGSFHKGKAQCSSFGLQQRDKQTNKHV